MKKIKAFVLKHKKLMIVLLLILAVLVFWGYRKKNGSEADPDQKKIVSVEKGEVVKKVKFVGGVELRTEQKLQFNKTGKVASVNVQEDSKVEKGELLATLDSTTALSDINRSQISVQNAREAYEEAYDEKKDEKKDLKNKLDLLEGQKDTLEEELKQLKLDGATKAVLEAKENEISAAENEIESAERDLDKMDDIGDLQSIKSAKSLIETQKTSLTDSQKELENYELRAPFAGVIRKIDLKVGDNLVYDNQKYIYIEDPGSLEIQANVSQSDVIHLKEGQKVDISFSFIEDKQFSGQVIDVERRPQQAAGETKTSYPVRIAIDQTDPRILPGMKAKITIVTETRADVLRVPSIAVLSEDSGYYVLKPADANASEIKQPVKIGLRGSSYTEILEGLAEGDQIVALNFTQLDERNKKEARGELKSEGEAEPKEAETAGTEE